MAGSLIQREACHEQRLAELVHKVAHTASVTGRCHTFPKPRHKTSHVLFVCIPASVPWMSRAERRDEGRRKIVKIVQMLWNLHGSAVSEWMVICLVTSENHAAVNCRIPHLKVWLQLGAIGCARIVQSIHRRTRQHRRFGESR